MTQLKPRLTPPQTSCGNFGAPSAANNGAIFDCKYCLYKYM